ASADLAAQARMMLAGRAGLESLPLDLGRGCAESRAGELRHRLGGGESHAEETGPGCRLVGCGAAARLTGHDAGDERSTQISLRPDIRPGRRVLEGRPGLEEAHAILLKIGSVPTGLGLPLLAEECNGFLRLGDRWLALAELRVLDPLEPEQVGL